VCCCYYCVMLIFLLIVILIIIILSVTNSHFTLYIVQRIVEQKYKVRANDEKLRKFENPKLFFAHKRKEELKQKQRLKDRVILRVCVRIYVCVCVCVCVCVEMCVAPNGAAHIDTYYCTKTYTLIV